MTILNGVSMLQDNLQKIFENNFQIEKVGKVLFKILFNLNMFKDFTETLVIHNRKLFLFKIKEKK